MTFTTTQDLWLALVGLIDLLTIGHALLNKRDPRAAWGWIAVCALFPLAGAVLYVLFGVNRVQTRARRLGLKTSRDLARDPSRLRPEDDEQGSAQLPGNLRALAHTGLGLSGLPLLPGNRIEPLHNGEAAYPRMLAAIDAATESVALATYLFDTDRVGHAFIDALARAARRGVRVRCLVDGLGERYSWTRASTLLRRAGVSVVRFNPLRLLPPSLHTNLRNHRKLLLIDGRLAFTGGMNISQRHLANDLDNPRRVRDLHFQIEGPLLDQLQRAFAEDWRYAADEAWGFPVPVTEPLGPSLCRVITDGPNEDLDHLRLVLLAAINAAQQRVAIMTPYFLPTVDLVTALQAAALRGVDTCLILPEQGDSRIVRWATEHMYGPLMERGVQIHLQPPPFTHTKLLLVDDCYVQFGSANLDPRSLRLNFELNVEAYDPALNAQLAQHFEDIRRQSSPVVAEDLAERGLGPRLRSALCWLFSPYL